MKQNQHHGTSPLGEAEKYRQAGLFASALDEVRKGGENPKMRHL